MHKRRPKTKKKCTKRQKMRGALRVRDEEKRKKRVRDEAKVEQTNNKRETTEQKTKCAGAPSNGNAKKNEK